MKERAIQTLGFFAVGDGEFPHQKKVLQGLMDSVEVTISNVAKGLQQNRMLVFFFPAVFCIHNSFAPSLNT